jgi:hypothetical protein
VIAVALATLAISPAPPSMRPTPIGVGARYRPAAASREVRRGEPIGELRCASGGDRFGIHLELFAFGRVVVVPSGIGVAAPLRVRGAEVSALGCSYPARTLAPTGVVEILRGSRLRLRDLFRIWNQPLGHGQLAGFTSSSPLLVFVNGQRWKGDPSDIPLRRHAQIVLELGAFVPPHPRFLFPGDL